MPSSLEASSAKTFYELAADYLAFFLRIAYAGKQIEEAVGRVYVYQVCVKVPAENIDDLLALTLAHKSVVDMDAYKLFADGFDEKRGDHRRIHAAGQRQKYFFYRRSVRAGRRRTRQ